ncbi:hypothetical protein DENSPDRAFT_835889 [Dentipellis sp. KUC8613]|nr:hypothetical protein DENSPDRAFT_835889 [Dentipellis sp. KUC8613]
MPRQVTLQPLDVQNLRVACFWNCAVVTYTTSKFPVFPPNLWRVQPGCRRRAVRALKAKVAAHHLHYVAHPRRPPGLPASCSYSRHIGPDALGLRFHQHHPHTPRAPVRFTLHIRLSRARHGKDGALHGRVRLSRRPARRSAPRFVVRWPALERARWKPLFTLGIVLLCGLTKHVAIRDQV